MKVPLYYKACSGNVLVGVYENNRIEMRSMLRSSDDVSEGFNILKPVKFF
jgi:hypothetical protein